MSASGAPKTEIPQLQRALSDDIAQLQQQGSRHTQEIFARMMGERYPDTITVGLTDTTVRGYGVPSVPGSIPGNAVVMGGLMVLIRSTNLEVTAGVLCTYERDTPSLPPAPASLFSYVDDPGINPLGPFVANGGPGRRIDVVECQVISANLLSSTVDIFDVPTQTFVPTLVVKTNAAQLTYRIRQGVQGAGYPGTVAGWLPLAVASHASASATFADVHFWDVRPLAQDRARGPFARTTNQHDSRILKRFSGLNPNGAADMASGFYDMEEPGLTRGNGGVHVMQGFIKNGAPGSTPALELDLLSPSILAPGTTFPPGNNNWGYLYAVFPFELPRWVPYSTIAGVTGDRLPEDTMGIMSLSRELTLSSGWQTVPVPNATGLNGVTPALWSARAVGVFFFMGLFNRFMPGGMTPSGAIMLTVASQFTGLFIAGVLGATTATSQAVAFQLMNLTQDILPQGVDRIRLVIEANFDTPLAGQYFFDDIEAIDVVSGKKIAQCGNKSWIFPGGAGPFRQTVELDFPLGSSDIGRSYFSLSVNGTFFFPATVTVGFATATLVGLTMTNK